MMSTESERYPAVYVIFTLLNTIRRGIERKSIWREFRRQKIALKPRLAFWLALCKEAGLLGDYTSSGPVNNQQLRVTRQARGWLNKTEEEQTFHLIESWQNAPKNRKARQFRKKLLWKLKYDKPLTQKDSTSINGLEALGLFQEGELTAWGRYFLKGEGELAIPKLPAPCQIHKRSSPVDEDRFIASLPQHMDLLWELENYLRPACPGIYPLTRRALQYGFAPGRRGTFGSQEDPHELIALLERGLQESLPGELKARLLDQPSLRVIEGIVIEFSHPEELTRLRRQHNMRHHVEQILSPRHIVISMKESKTFFQMLKRRGIYLTYHEETPEACPERSRRAKKQRTHFPQKPQLLQPAGKDTPKLELLEKYLQLQQAIDVLYRAPGYPAEKRRITPLVIEQRGEHTYVIAFCQTRRAQRLFRLDRMEIPGTY